MQNILAIWAARDESYFVLPIAYRCAHRVRFLFRVFLLQHPDCGRPVHMMQAAYGQGSPRGCPGHRDAQLLRDDERGAPLYDPDFVGPWGCSRKRRSAAPSASAHHARRKRAGHARQVLATSFLAIMFATSGLRSPPLPVRPAGMEAHPRSLSRPAPLWSGSPRCRVVSIDHPENQIVAGLITFGVILLLWLIDSYANSAQGVMRDVLSYLSVISHLNDFIKG